MKWVLAAALAALLGTSAWAQDATGADTLQGMWVSRTVFPSLSGELVVDRQGGVWRAHLGGEEAQFAAPNNGDVRFAFGDRGEFRGRLARNGAIEGFWIRPRSGVPTAPPQRFASPLTLRRAGAAWRGEVVPLRDSFTLYLRIFRDEEGVLMGAFRNPEYNARGGASRLPVTREGDAVTFLIRADDTEVRHDAVLSDTDHMRIHWQDSDQDLVLARVPEAQAEDFFPRPPNAAAYAYRRPSDAGDGWRTARARDVGLDEAVLAAAVQRIASSDPTARPPTLMHSMLVARRGRLVLEEYFFGHDRDTVHDVRSAGKTFSSILMGAAMQDGVAISPETRVYELFAGAGPFANPDPRKAQITLSHLMTHSAGLACDDNNEDSPGNEGTVWTQSAPFWRYTLDLPMAHEPGRIYAYCSANLNLVGGALTQATGEWLPAYFDRIIARPLQFGRYYWNISPDGEGYLGGGAYLRPRDLLKVGQMYLDGGVWRGRRIVPESWVALSTAPRVEISPATTGLSEEEFGNYYGRSHDGLAWHRSQFRVGERVVEGYNASGNGGQLLVVVPEYQLVVVFTGGNYSQGGVWTRWPDQIIGGAIIPAIRD